LKKKPVAAAISIALCAMAAPTWAQQQAAQPAEDAGVQKVEVSGIRASLAKSLSVKKDATANVEVITAEDVGKMPDKNLADSLQRLAGVAVRTDYDEAEKVSMRGTNPDMSLILFNGHTVSGGDWYVADQGSSSRSTSLSLMPSSVLNQAIVYKTSQANIVDGGMAGTINVTTRKPLNEKSNFGGVIRAGLTYAQLPGKTSPDMNATFNWKNEDNTFGVITQVFKEKRYVRRDSVSRFAYGASSGWDVINTSTMKGITDASLAGTGLKAADLNGVRMPGSMSSEFVEGVRDRAGGMMSLQFRPNKDLDITATGFYSEMKAENNGRLTAGAIYSMLLGKGDPVGGVAAASINNGPNNTPIYAQIRNPVIVNETTMYGHQLRVLKSADIVFPDGSPPMYIGNSEGFYREGAKATSGFLDLDAKYRVNSDLTVKSLFSTTRGIGTTKGDQGLTYARYGTGISYGLNGLEDAPNSHYTGAGSNTPTLNPDGSGYKLVGRTISGIRTEDKESSGQLDAEYKLDKGVFQSIEAGVRFSDHKRNSRRWSPAFRNAIIATADPSGSIPYPADFGSDIGGGSWDNTGFSFTPEALKAYMAANLKTTSDEWERRVSTEIDMRERQTAAYAMQNLEGEGWSGNIGLRWVRTRINAQIPTPIPSGACQRTEPGKPATVCAQYPGAITTAGEAQSYYDGAVFNPNSGVLYFKTATDRTYNTLLPSLNLRYELDKNMIARFGASRTIGRQNYNLLGSGFTSPTCDATGCVVTGPNPDLKPLTSDNLDLSWAWYFKPRSLVSVNVFHSKIDGYVKTGGTNSGTTIQLPDPRTPSVIQTFTINSSTQQGAKISGIELAYEQPLWGNFGFQSNVSRAKTKVDDGRPMVGASEWAGNLGVYYENDVFSTRLVGNYRGKYVNSSTAPAPSANSQGLSTINGVLMPTAPTMAAGVTTVAFSANYTFAKNWQVSFDATNLLNQVRAQYRYSEEEQQKVDVSGRQFYLNLKYKF
jgi:iron complex outermembrane receptor protein